MYYLCIPKGEMAEWSNAVVLKTIVRQRTGGSNPSLSADVKSPPKGLLKTTDPAKSIFCGIFLCSKKSLQDQNTPDSLVQGENHD